MKPFKTEIASNALDSMLEQIDRNKMPGYVNNGSHAEEAVFLLSAWERRLSAIFEAHKAAAAIEMEYHRNLAIMAAMSGEDGE